VNILRRELKRNLRSWLIWTVSIALFVVFTLSFFPTMAKEGAKWDELMAQLPPQFSMALNLDQLNMSDLLGWFGTESYLMLMLFGGIYAAMLGASIVSKEEGDRTIEFLLAKPVSRAQIITQKLLAGAFWIFALNAVICVCSFIGFALYNQGPYDQATALYLFLASFIVQLLLFAASMLISLFLPKAKAAMPTAIGLVLGTYFLNVMGELSERAAWLRHLSPFRYADAAEIIQRGQVEWGYIALAIGLTLLCAALSYRVYQHKDITA